MGCVKGGVGTGQYGWTGCVHYDLPSMYKWVVSRVEGSMDLLVVSRVGLAAWVMSRVGGQYE